MRWCVRIASLKRIHNKDVYNACVSFFEEEKNDRTTDVSACATANGFYNSVCSFDFYFHLVLVIAVLERVEILNAALQSCTLSTNEAQNKLT